MSAYKGIDAETMEAAVDTIMTRGWWTEAEKTKFLEEWHKLQNGRLQEEQQRDKAVNNAISPKP